MVETGNKGKAQRQKPGRRLPASEDPELCPPWNFENTFIGAPTPQTDHNFNPILFMYLFALEEVPGNYIKFPKLTWAFLAAPADRNKASHWMWTEGPTESSFLLLLWLFPLKGQGLCGGDAPSS